MKRRSTGLMVARRQLLRLVGGLAVLTLQRPALAQQPMKQSTEEKATMNIQRNGSRPSTKGAQDVFSGSVRVEPVFQVGDPMRLNAGKPCDPAVPAAEPALPPWPAASSPASSPPSSPQPKPERTQAASATAGHRTFRIGRLYLPPARRHPLLWRRRGDSSRGIEPLARAGAALAQLREYRTRGCSQRPPPHTTEKSRDTARAAGPSRKSQAHSAGSSPQRTVYGVGNRFPTSSGRVKRSIADHTCATSTLTWESLDD